VRALRLTLLTGVLVVAQPAHACSCSSTPPPLEALREADFVAVVRVESVAWAWRVYAWSLVQAAADALGAEDELYEYPNRRIGVEVVELLKGRPLAARALYTTWGDGDCGFPFEDGALYLVYGHEHEGAVQVNICSRTRAFDAQARAEVALLRRARR
jgi:hypothetical protein